MNQVVARHPDMELHVVLDNLSTHTPKRDRWLARYPRVTFHYTPLTPPGSTRWRCGSAS
ncbi:MAG: hypothetical protein HY681_02080 [Chloroflexi bacterium]|nr:hypothetical protein [Chloroflexota bacterium]